MDACRANGVAATAISHHVVPQCAHVVNPSDDGCWKMYPWFHLLSLVGVLMASYSIRRGWWLFLLPLAYVTMTKDQSHYLSLPVAILRRT